VGHALAGVALATALGFGFMQTVQTASAQDSAAFSIDQAVVVNDDSLNLRSEALLDSDIVATLADGQVATVIDGPVSSDGYTWYQLEVAGVTGWAAGEFLAAATSEAGLFLPGDSVFITDDSVNLRAEPGLDGELLTTLPAGTSGTVLAGPETVDGSDWYQLDLGGNTGWVAREFLAFGEGATASVGSAGTDASTASTVSATVSAASLNVRDAAGLSGSVIATLAGGQSITVISGAVEADGYSWYQVETPDGTTGWVAGDFLSLGAAGGNGKISANKDEGDRAGSHA
jgi:uncharacterized protein YgiM (DUF1202 family)